MNVPIRSFTQRVSVRGLFVVAAASLFWTLSVGADEPDVKTQERIATVGRQAKEFVERCNFTSTESAPASFRLIPEPILRWSNPTAGAVYGDIHLYTHRGRPATIVSFYRWFTPDWGSTIEVCSLHPTPIMGVSNGVRFWTPKASPLQWGTLSDVDAPAASAAARLPQLRRIASDFTAQLIDTRANAAGVRRPLRRLTQPVFRYPPPVTDSNYLDGAMFAFVEGTDPELLLFVEAVSAAKSAVWQYGIARLNRDQLEVLHGDKVVWEADYISDPNERILEPYSTFSAEMPLKPVR
ncbi:MAG: hypothetical protein Q8K78_11340 [Planctomycetaceae bacterium]|nr:hypothetical protein [Planctomycetaceae bacterium]